jgi:hypothetical protein
MIYCGWVTSSMISTVYSGVGAGQAPTDVSNNHVVYIVVYYITCRACVCFQAYSCLTGEVAESCTQQY